jgi:DNA-binding response OmpR family regulator
MESLNKIPALAVIPIIVVSARDVIGNQKRAFEAGARAFLQKPVNDAELLAVIRQALEEPAGTKTPTLYNQGAL